MKVKNLGWVLCLLLLGTSAAYAQSIASVKKEIYNCYVYSNSQNWLSCIEKMRQAVGNSSLTEDQLELVEAQYAYVGYCLTRKLNKEADSYISKTQRLLKDILKKDPKSARANALYGALLAMEINRSPAKSMYLGPKSSSYIEKSKKYDAGEPVVWVEQGNFRFHAPSLFGGDKKKALASFEKAAGLFEANGNRKKNNWMYLHSLVWLAKSYEATGNRAQAMATYGKALAYEPNFSWVRNELLPQMQGKR